MVQCMLFLSVDFHYDEMCFNLHCAGIENLHLARYVAVGQIVAWGVCFELRIAFGFKKLCFLHCPPLKYFSKECLKENTLPNSVVIFYYCCRNF